MRRMLVVTAVSAAAAGAVVWIFLNTYLDLLVTALCVGYSSMVLFTIAGNVRQAVLPREALQLLAIIAGSVLGTILAGFVKGRSIGTMFSERLSGVAISMGLGIGFGCVVVATVILREKHARDQALIRKPIKELLDERDPAKFWQVHRATIVNVDHIAAVRRGLKDQAEIALKESAETLVVSRAFTHLFKQM